MEYAEKLNFLFELSGAEGKELAKELEVTPPQISKMRKGVRGLPKNKDDALIIARFFALRCISEQQRLSLSAALRVEQIKDMDNCEALGELLLDWLSDTHNPSDYAAKHACVFLRRFGVLYDNQILSAPGDTGKAFSEGQSFYAYYGNEGKRLAVKTFLNYLYRRKKAYCINFLSDEDTEWIIEEPSYSEALQSNLLRLAELGCTFRRIMGPADSMEKAFESLNRWFPLYMSGKATTYYYKRMRDSLNRVTIFSVPDVAVLFSFSVTNRPHNEEVTFFTTDSHTVNSMNQEFENYFSMCTPVTKVYSTNNSLAEIHECMLKYEEFGATCTQRSNSLSFITMPWDVVATLRVKGIESDKERFLSNFTKRQKEFKANLEQYGFTDIVRLADPEDVLQGKVIIPAAMVLGAEHQNYTPSAYLQHLKNVLSIAERYRNYDIVIDKTESNNSTTIVYVKEDGCAILARDSFPFTMFEVSERLLVGAFGEYLHRLIPESKNAVKLKRETTAELRQYITELETLLRERGIIK